MPMFISRIHIHLSREQLDRIVNIQGFAHYESFSVLNCDQRAVESLTRLNPSQERFRAEVSLRLFACGVVKLRAVTAYSAMLLLGEIARVHNKGRSSSAWEHEVGDRLRAKSLLARFYVVFGESGDVDSLSHYLARVNVIRMWIFPVMSEDNSRSIETNLTHHLDSRLFTQPDMTIRKFKIVANHELQFSRGGLRLKSSNLSRTARTHFSAGHVH